MDEQRINRLIEDNQQTLAKFIKIEIQTAMLYLRLAETETYLQDEKGARRARELARLAYDTAVRFLPQVKRLTAEERREIVEQMLVLHDLFELDSEA